MEKIMSVDDFYYGLDKMFAQHDNEKTEKYMLDALEQAKGDVNMSLIIAISNELGGFYRAKGDVEKAKLLNDSVLAALKEIGQENSMNYAVALINAGNAHNSAREYDKALPMYKQAEALLEALGQGRDYQMAALCNNMSAAYREREDFEEAEKMARKSIIIISSIQGKRRELATSLINLGEVQTRLKKFDEAEETLKTAVAIYEVEAGGVDIHYAAAMAALGALYYYRRDFDASIEAYQKTLKLIERDFGHTPYYEMIQKNLKQVEEERPN